MCVKLTFISRLRNSIMANCSSFNTRDTGRTVSVQRQTFCKGRKCGVLPDNAYIRLFPILLTEANHEWTRAENDYLCFLIDDRCGLFISISDGNRNAIFRLREVSSMFKQLTKSIQLGEDARFVRYPTLLIIKGMFDRIGKTLKLGVCDWSFSLPSYDVVFYRRDRSEWTAHEQKLSLCSIESNVRSGPATQWKFTIHGWCQQWRRGRGEFEVIENIDLSIPVGTSDDFFERVQIYS